jgi:hypothetical protein
LGKKGSFENVIFQKLNIDFETAKGALFHSGVVGRLRFDVPQRSCSRIWFYGTENLG